MGWQSWTSEKKGGVWVPNLAATPLPHTLHLLCRTELLALERMGDHDGVTDTQGEGSGGQAGEKA